LNDKTDGLPGYVAKYVGGIWPCVDGCLILGAVLQLVFIPLNIDNLRLTVEGLSSSWYCIPSIFQYNIKVHKPNKANNAK